MWKFIKERGCDTNSAYNVLLKMGIPGRKLRVGPPLMNVASVSALQIAARAWPFWFDKVCERCPGARLAANFGARVVKPYRRVGETWEQTFMRECVNEAPEWIRDRAVYAMETKLRDHAHHADSPFAEVESCPSCGSLGSWKVLAHVIWGGDPYVAYTAGLLPLIEPEFFRKGAGTWVGHIQEKIGHKVRIMT